MIGAKYGIIDQDKKDADATAYLQDAGITDRQEVIQIYAATDRLKLSGLWDKCYVIRPISPTSLDAARYNLKDSSTYTGTWHGTSDPTHTQSGVAFDGIDQYGTTGFNPNTVIGSSYNEGITLSRTKAASSVKYYCGASSGGVGFGLTQRADGTNTNGFDRNNGAPASAVDADGVWTLSRRAADELEYYKDGVSQVTESTTATVGQVNDEILIGAFALGGSPSGTSHSNYTLSFLVIHQGLTDDEAYELYSIINAYDTALRP
jgi:hypothetical protein